MKVAVIQIKAGSNKNENVGKALEFVQSAIKKNAEFIILPEIFNFRGRISQKENRSIAEHIPGESILPFQGIARGSNVYILAGSIYEQVESSRKSYNTSILINNKGRIQATYRKIHLFDAVINKRAIKESRSFLRGDQIAVTSVKEFKVGLSICYDLRFPELYNMCTVKGASVFCIPSCFTKQTGQAHWEILLRARA
ncbi:MAG: nitrilase-related carbon-nitrogen hydrolase, partial [Thermodesulfobacteriota bacterium]|nr:nitrilase-related carbon-nitrogen hydrolase [Thermodesulfobacteriota bacterium]